MILTQTNIQIVQIFDFLLETADKSENKDGESDDGNNITELIENLKNRYLLETIGIVQYYIEAETEREKNRAIENFCFILKKLDLENSLALFSLRLKTKCDTIDTLIDVTKEQENTCCGNFECLNSEAGEYYCANCGKLEFGDITVTVLNSQQDRRIRSPCTESINHWKSWYNKIFAKEDINIDKCTEVLQKVFAQHQLYGPDLTCQVIREYLEQYKLAEFYDYVPLIRKKLTGISPPQPTKEEEDLMFQYFIKCINAYNIIKDNQKSHKPYCPYFIYKIVELVYKNQPKKKRDILMCIHMQTPKTTIKNDKIWKEICTIESEFQYSPTSPFI